MLTTSDLRTNQQIAAMRKEAAESAAFRIDFRVNPDGSVDLRHDKRGGETGVGVKAYITAALQFAHRVGGLEKAMMLMAATIQELKTAKQKVRQPAETISPILGPDAKPAFKVEEL